MAGTHMTMGIQDMAGPALAALGQRLTDLTPAMRDVGEYMLRETEERFRKETDPVGRPWQALKPKTLAAKIRKHKSTKILTRDHRLRSSINYEPSRRSVEIGSPLVYAAVHQLGGVAGQNIPARPFLGVNAQNMDEIGRIIADYLLEDR